MIEIGKYNTLKVLRSTSVGVFLGDEEGNDVLLPEKYIPEETLIGDELNVFIYKDGEERLIATTLQPKVQLHQFAYLEVAMVNQMGAFLDWGLEKDLFVPYREQLVSMREGKSYLIYMYVDEKSGRLTATEKISRFLDNQELALEEGDEVEVIIWKATDLGINVVINGQYQGLIYFNEIFKPLKPGETHTAYIKTIREDNKIDVMLQKPGYEQIEPNAQKILAQLKAKGGFLPLTDKSPPSTITHLLEMSKKNFKKAIGSLYKQKIIRLEKDGIYLLSDAN